MKGLSIPLPSGLAPQSLCLHLGVSRSIETCWPDRFPLGQCAVIRLESQVRLWLEREDPAFGSTSCEQICAAWEIGLVSVDPIPFLGGAPRLVPATGLHGAAHPTTLSQRTVGGAGVVQSVAAGGTPVRRPCASCCA